MRLDVVQIIKDKVTMKGALERYGYEVKKRMPCPLHCGKDANFEIKGNSWRCYSHCGSGDTISFVQKLFGLSFQDTLKKMDADFALGAYSEQPFEVLRESHFRQRALQAKREREEKEKKKADDEYWAAYDEWLRLDQNKREYKPKQPCEELHPLFVESLQKLDYQKYVLDCLDERRMAL